MKLTTGIRKRFRVSNKVKKVASKNRFRLSISRSSKNIFAQIIDDTKNVTLLSASSIEKDVKSSQKINKSEMSKIVAEKLAKKLAKGPTKAYGAVKKLLSKTFEQPLEAQLDDESRHIAAMAASDDGREGLDAFLNKRKPSFKGK